jgi:hypothetical protein
MDKTELEKLVWELRESVTKLELECTGLSKNKIMLWRAIKSLRSSVLALSTKEAKQKQLKALKDAEELGKCKEQSRRNLFKRFFKWVGTPAFFTGVVCVCLAWGFSFLKKAELIIMLNLIKSLFD